MYKVTWYDKIDIQGKKWMGEFLHFLYSLHAFFYTLENWTNIET